MRSRLFVALIVVVLVIAAAVAGRAANLPVRAQTPPLAPIMQNEIVNDWCPAESRSICERANYQAFPDGSMRVLFALNWKDGSETCPADMDFPINVDGWAFEVDPGGNSQIMPISVYDQTPVLPGVCEMVVYRIS
jgi:hypothetical protein